MKIAVIGTGNVGGALASKWASKGHHIILGTKDPENFKGKTLLEQPNIKASNIQDAVKQAEVILIAVPATAAAETAAALGDTSGKLIIDAMNIVMGRGPVGFNNTADAILANTNTQDVIKCFNTTGFNNMVNPIYGAQTLDMFMAGDSKSAKEIVAQLALDAGFATCIDVGGKDKYTLLESFAFFWINLAMMQGQGRDIGFKLLKR